MIIGVDFDNTIVCYDALFHRVALERGLIPADLSVNKTAVRDHLRATGREETWTEMQGEVYGARMAEAAPYPGVIAYFLACREQRIPIRIISHKTRHPYLGERHDLHAAARNWLRLHGFFDAAQIGLRDDDVFFELTKTEKLNRIGTSGCTHFIDDLPELLTATEFPPAVVRFLFDPESVHADATDFKRLTSWSEFQSFLLGSEPWLQAALAIAKDHGAIQSSVQALHGGANNRVFRLGDSVVVKHYFQHAGDARDRYASEKAFYDYATTTAQTCLPRALGWDETNRLGVFEYVRGTRLVKAEAEHVQAALHFFRELNAQRDCAEARKLPPAAEACLSLDAHLATVRRRVEGVTSLPRHDELDVDAAEFVAAVLQPLWKGTCNGLNSTFTASERSQELPPQTLCISPSDFGFHNALVRGDGRLVFLDFEYAGWDDPAKLVSDFFCQPDVPVAQLHFDRVITSVVQSLRLTDSDRFALRCRSLLPLYQIKWSCILLNDFTQVGRSRREFSLGPSEAAARRQRQLTRARQILGILLVAA